MLQYALHTRSRLERAQEVDDFLLLLGTQLIELVNDLIGLAARAFVIADGFNQVRRAPIVKEEDPLPYAPKRSGSEFVRASATLRNAISQTFTHVVDEEVGPEVYRLVR